MRRLKTRPQFQAVLGGMTVSKTPRFALHVCALPPSSEDGRPPLFAELAVWLGAMVPKRWAKRAVTRNAIKRQIYSVGQEFAATLQLRAHVVRLRSGYDKSLFPSASSEALRRTVREELQLLFTRAGALATPVANPAAP
ncbi:MAG: ribonuclease P protein component [Rhodoferax sp.]|nr:ribonuclease P protein component [Rhodoferax sp.]